MSAAIRNPDPPPAAPLANPVAEAAIIAGLMNCGDPTAIGRYALDNRLDLECFTQTAYRLAYAAITDLAADGLPVDIPILAGRLDAEALATVDSACREHVSDANFTHYARLLHGCKQRRAEAAARDRLAQAVASGAPPHELDAIVESIKKAGTDEASTRLKFCDTAKLRDAELIPPRFLIHPLLPRDQVTLFGGHGGGGKTLVGYVLCAHVATGTDFAGMRVMPGKVLVVSFEDPEELILWRFRNIADEYGLDMDKMVRNIKIVDATEAQPIMRELSERGVRDVQPTRDGSDLMEIIRHEKFDLVQIDNVSDAFDGDENSRRQVRKFVRYLASAIRVHQGALLLLAHIDKAAARYGAQGNSYSGSTAWHNSARSRLALIDGKLTQEKLNVGKKLDDGIRFRFTPRGVPVLDDGAGDRAERNQQEQTDDSSLLECFVAAKEAGASVPTAESGPATTWHALSVYREFPKELLKNKVRFRQGIARLVRDGKLVREPYQDTHRNKRERYALVCVSSALVREPTQPTPCPPACVSSSRGYGGTNERTQRTDAEPTHATTSNRVDLELTQNHEPTHHAEEGNGSGHAGDNQDISRDIAIAPPAESPSTAAACAGKVVDITIDPLAARIAELEAAGWSPWNAEARARSEALEARQAGGAS